LVTEPAQSGGDGGVADFAGAGFVPARHVGDLDLPAEWQGALDKLDEVTLADLGVVEVQVYAQVRAIDGGVEVLQREHPAGALAELGEAGEVREAVSHIAGVRQK
jgi:hypothetical protein